MDHREDRRRGLRRVMRALLVSTTTAATAAGIAIGTVALAQGASAEPAAQPELSEKVAKLTPARQGGDVGTNSTGSGSHSGDFTGDAIDDILARDARNGQLKVYPHSGSYSGTATFRPSTTINFGWGGMRWIGQGDLSGDGRPDVIYVDQSGVMRVAQHSGTYSGTSTLLAGQVLGTGWNTTSLIFTDDWNADGFTDILAQRRSTGDIYLYLNNGGITGQATFQAPQLAIFADNGDVDMAMADFTGDGFTDLVFKQADGLLGLFDIQANVSYLLGFGWETINAITLADVNADGLPDVLGRRASNGNLQSYTHTGTWAPQPPPDNTAFNTLRAPVVIGLGWQINNVIT